MTAVRRALRAVHRYLQALTGETAYEEYLSHHRRAGSGTPPLTRHQFETHRHTPRPGTRCC